MKLSYKADVLNVDSWVATFVGFQIFHQLVVHLIDNMTPNHADTSCGDGGGQLSSGSDARTVPIQPFLQQPLCGPFARTLAELKLVFAFVFWEE